MARYNHPESDPTCAAAKHSAKTALARDGSALADFQRTA